MAKRILVVGGVAGGASAAARVRRLDEHAEVIIFEKGPHVSFSNCSLPYHLSGIVENSDSLVLMNPDIFKNRYNIDARVNSEVVKINRGEKTITVNDVVTGKTYEESYDKLILSPGASPIRPGNIEGINQPNVFTVRNVVDIEKLNAYVKNKNIKDVAVIGGGYIGVEVAENLRLANYNVSLVEFANQIMAPFDYDMAQILHKEMVDHGVNLIVDDGLATIGEGYIETQSGKKIDAQAVVLAIGVRPETKLAEEAGLEIGDTGAIKVDGNYVTNDKDIYAGGDAIEVYHRLLHKPTRLALAGPAQKQARAVADHIYGIPSRNLGVIGSSSIHLFDLNAASTGLNARTADSAGFSYDSVYIMPGDKVGLMPNSNVLHFKLVYETPTGRILGAQAIGKGNVDKRIDVIATMITMNGTLEDLKDVELTYSPMLGTAKDVVNHAALVALNQLSGKYREVKVSEVRDLVENNAFIIDAREKNEYAAGHFKNAVHIPLSEFRERLDEIPTDQPVYIHCRSGQRSYNMVMALQNLGYNNVFNMSGSYLGINLYEYFNDLITGREKIVTEYNFK
ncbi:NADPH-dependent 2,4-dienoyl-CoA reductase/sulfur reductase-like enzyme/rhodanese-related sulfurtransferase [Gracilibacillus halotolerans]|uniref:NADPH-dependent 2,4-dienoyl-CoA reductase/sulfur reductase-like enzyme/rhodanese-related sulfurtransferase n=1 Tax=Gracilibacillus halotolerans TaxID=74386 RepID=A0A841RN43_9BACI|nr:FAD-dependent oxidoreductase [Gracilibacillus halotolerans]MBB6514251.1 NADPH-dependent 2,4-dienoyl-CoA reductase/sulfur reductase-like enzyme/rhodanese-related sulfurtransferase [Gracilibacillus halotolerans]